MATALEYIHALAEETTELGQLTTTALGTATTLVCSTLANTTLAATELANMYVLVESGACAGQVGSVLGGGLDRSTGTLTVGDAFTTTIASGTAFSVYRLLPPIRETVLPGLLQVVNQAVRRLPIERTLTLTGVSGQTYYAVSQTLYPWLTGDHRVMWVEYPVTTAGTVPIRMADSGWEWDVDGETRRIFFPSAPFATGQSFTVKVLAPGNSRFKKNATAYATLSGATVASITGVTGGSYIARTPSVTLSGGGGTGATATALVSGNTVVGYTVTAPGSGYTSAPVVTVATGDWADAATQTDGLASLTDEAIPDVADVVTVGKARMYDLLSRMHAPGANVAEWLAKAQPSVRAARDLIHRGPKNDRTLGVAQTRPTLVGGTRRGYSDRGLY